VHRERPPVNALRWADVDDVNRVNDATIEKDGWALLSTDEHQNAHPGFLLPSISARASVAVGQAVKLLFDIETRENGQVIDRGVDRMWVIVRCRLKGRYVGVLDSDPGRAENLSLRPGDEIVFGPEHVTDIDSPPRDYVLQKYGADFFVDESRGPTGRST
jgi:hypothetical protein